jgi:broad specificity phosphatase PhoE
MAKRFCQALHGLRNCFTIHCNPFTTHGEIMTVLFFIRHAESVANARHLLAGRVDFPLSETGKEDAKALAQDFSCAQKIDVLWCSPLLRAQQTAAPFVLACDAPLRIDERLQEQHLGRFSGMTYAEAEADPAYCRDRSARWDWTPEGGGESYRAISERVHSFLVDLRTSCEREHLERILLVTHAVTLRLFRASLEATLPRYPEEIAENGEVWRVKLAPAGSAVMIETVDLKHGTRKHRA